MEAIDNSGYALFAQRARLDYRTQSGLGDTQAIRNHGHRQHHGDYQALRSRDAHHAEQADQKLGYFRAERSVLKIRTQEGDIVALRIRVSEALRLTGDQSSDDETQVAEARLAARSSTRVSLTVKGDLNADELAAIQSVFEQSAALADEFFAGDVAAAFDAASGLEIDAQQLATVSLRLKLRESLTYSPASDTASLRPAAAAISAPPSAAPVSAQPAAEEQAPAATPITAVAALDPSVESDSSESPAAPAPASQTGFWFSTILDFVGRLFDSFDDVATEQPDGAGTAPQASLELSLKLRIFSSMLIEISSSGAGNSEQNDPLPALVPQTIEAVATQQDPPLDTVA